MAQLRHSCDVIRRIHNFKMAECKKNLSKRKHLQYLYENVSDDVDFLVSNTSLSQATAYRAISKLKAGEPVQRKKGGGHPRCFGSDDRRRLAQLAHRNRTESGRNLGEEMVKRGSCPVSDRTVRRHLKQMGYWSILPTTVPMLSAENMQKRVELAQKFEDFHWESAIFSYESSIKLFGNTKNVWTDTKKENRAKKPMPLKSPSFMVWGAISVKGQSSLRIVDGSMDHLKYQEVLEDTLLPYVAQNFPDFFVFQQDNAPPYRAKSTVTWMSDVIPHVLPWPARVQT